MRLEVLFFEGCPSHDELLPTLQELTSEHGAELVSTAVETHEHAEQARFLGSPSVQVEGRDIEPGAETRTDFGMKCRLYRSEQGQSGVPPREWIGRALREAGAA
jgi:hypothetical protein